jgi:hypothetical protein
MDDAIMTEHRAMTSRRDVVQLLAAAALSGGAAISTSPADAEIGRRDFDAIHLEKGRIDMTQDLASLAPEHFEPLIGHTFTIGDHQVTLRDVRRRGRTTSRFREQSRFCSRGHTKCRSVRRCCRCRIRRSASASFSSPRSSTTPKAPRSKSALRETGARPFETP